jgi:tetratricopeptide (TPR) repeat protein
MEILRNSTQNTLVIRRESLACHVRILVLIFGMLMALPAAAQTEVIDAFRESYALESAGQYREAGDKLKAVYQSESYEINLRLGWLLYQSGQVKESVEAYEKAVGLKPYAIEPKLGLALPLSMQGEWDRIIGIYQNILEMDPQNSLVNYRLGLIYYNRAEFDRADPYLEKVVNLYPFDYDGLVLLAWNKLKLQKSREAKVLFNKVLMNNPGDESATEGLQLIKL